jgi:two-component system NarL family sensor kinase
LIDEMGSLLDDFHQRIRGITYVLHPPELEDGGLCPALKSLCEGLARRTSFKIDLRIHGDCLSRKDRSEAVAYRVIQEALTNVLRHAQSTFVQVRLCLRAETVLLVVRDDGVGLRNQPKGHGGNLELGVGIAGITARVCKLGGQFVFRDAHGQSGAFLAAVLPRDGEGAAARGAISRTLFERLTG